MSTKILNFIRFSVLSFAIVLGAGYVFATLVNAQTAPVPTVTLTSISPIVPGGSTTLTWSSTNATSCVASGQYWMGSEPTSGSSNIGFGFPGSYTMGLTCTGPGGTTSASTVIIVATNASSAPTVKVHPTAGIYDVGGFYGWNRSDIVVPADWISISPHTVMIIAEIKNADSCVAGGELTSITNGAEPVPGRSFIVPSSTLTLGKHTYSITCTGPGGTTTDSGTVNVVAKTSDLAPTVTISASPTTVTVGGTTTITWSAVNPDNTPASSCNTSGFLDPQSGTIIPVSGSRLVTVPNITGLWPYGVLCSNQWVSKGAFVEVRVTGPAPVIKISVPSTNVVPGASTVITWSTKNATRDCTASGDWGGTPGWINGWSKIPGNTDSLVPGVEENGTFLTGPLSLGTHTYTLSCNDALGQTGSATATIIAGATPSYVQTEPVPNIYVYPGINALGGKSTITWSTAFAKSCTLSGEEGVIGTSGESINGKGYTNVISKSSPGIYYYELKCVGNTGIEKSSYARIIFTADPPCPLGGCTAQSPMASIFSLTPFVASGDSVELNWRASSVTSCTGFGDWSGTKELSGDQMIKITSDGAKTFGLSCTGPNGDAKGSFVFRAKNGNTVSNPPSIIPPITPSSRSSFENPTPSNENSTDASVPTVSIAATPTTVKVGEAVTLTWSSANAIRCVATGTWYGAKKLSGSQIVKITSTDTKTYGLSCTGTDGRSKATAKVVIEPGKENTVTAQTIDTGPGDTDPNAPKGDCVDLKNNLRYRDRDAQTDGEVSIFQDFLQSKDYLSTDPTGFFGILTLRAAKVFQKAVGLNPTGYVGPQTRAKIKALTCAGDHQTPLAPVVTISAAPKSVTVGGSSTITYVSTNVTQGCVASGDWSGVNEGTGTYQTGPLTAGLHTYILTCTGGLGITGSGKATVKVKQTTEPVAPTTTTTTGVPVVTLTASPSTINSGDSVTLDWTATGAINGCTIFLEGNTLLGEAVPVARTGKITDSGTVKANNVTTYYKNNSSYITTSPILGKHTFLMKCRGDGQLAWTDALAYVTVNPTTSSQESKVTISATPASLPANSKYGVQRVTWSIPTTFSTADCHYTYMWGGHPTKLSDSTLITYYGGPNIGGVIAGNGMVTTGEPNVNTIGLSCTNSSGTQEAKTTLSVVPPVGATPVINFSAAPAVVVPGGSSTLTWSAPGATSCFAKGQASLGSGWNDPEGGLVEKGLSGTYKTEPLWSTDLQGYTYILICSGPGGGAMATTTVRAQ